MLRSRLRESARTGRARDEALGLTLPDPLRDLLLESTDVMDAPGGSLWFSGPSVQFSGSSVA